MFYRSSYKLLPIIIFVISTVVIAQNNPQQNQKAQKIYQQYQEISQQLEGVQKQALEDEKIQKQSEEFTQELKTEMIRQDSSVEGKISRQEKLMEEYKKAQASGSKEEMTAIQQKFQGVSQDLQSVQQKALQNPELVKERDEFNNALIAKMTEIEPKTPDLLAQLQSLSQKLQQSSQH